jgi:hypothetical protein
MLTALRCVPQIGVSKWLRKLETVFYSSSLCFDRVSSCQLIAPRIDIEHYVRYSAQALGAWLDCRSPIVAPRLLHTGCLMMQQAARFDCTVTVL